MNPTPITIEDDDGNTVTLPTRWEVCPKCDGRGVQCRIGAMTASEFNELFDDDESREDYKRGLYDEACATCRGLRVIEAVDEGACDPRLLELYHADLRVEAELRADEESERRYMYGPNY